MIYTEDREQFERDILRPGRFVRLAERAGPYIDGMDQPDKAYFLETALDVMWDRRAEVESTSGLLKLWDEALETAAFSRPRWLVSVGLVHETRQWVKSIHLRRR